MSAPEQRISRHDGTPPPPRPESSARLESVDPAALAATLSSTSEPCFDARLGAGAAIPLPAVRLELYDQVVRVNLPTAQVAMLRTTPEVSPESVVFQHADGVRLAVAAAGAVVFQAAPIDAVGAPFSPARRAEPEAAPARPSSAPASPEGKPKSERYVGRLGEVKLHQTRAGKLVAEVALTVDDPERPGAAQLVKFAAFDAMAEALRDRYRPGQLVTAVGLPHELKRRDRDGREWVERQLYFVQPPKPRD